MIGLEWEPLRLFHIVLIGKRFIRKKKIKILESNLKLITQIFTNGYIIMKIMV